MSEGVPSVLVVEDDPEINALVGAYVELCGFEYRPALDGAAAIAQARVRPPTVVVLDLMMPGLNGYEVCSQLRAAPQTTQTPIIILSALGDATSRQRSQMNGANEHLVKPFDPDAFMSALKHFAGDPQRA